MNRRILFVDDDPKVLSAFQRGLSEVYEVETAVGGEEGLRMLEDREPFAVIVADMRMPKMDGVQFLTAVKDKCKNSVRMMLTGNADQETAVNAVNEGNIFRFLTKPCLSEVLTKALDAGIEQYRLITAEKELLERTLQGSVKVLSDVLALANPMAFGHATRVRHLIREICKQMEIEKPWQLEIAAMLSQIGCVTVPTNTLEKVYHGRPLTSEEARMMDAHPGIGKDLVANIPRLEEVAQIIAYQQKGYDGSGVPNDSISGTKIPLGARILRVALDYELLKWSGCTGLKAITKLRSQALLYDPEVLMLLEKNIRAEKAFDSKEVFLKDLALYTILADDVTTPDGVLIVGKGQEVTPSLCQRLRNFAQNSGLEDVIKISICVDKEKA